jgi:hypothetical protein
LFHEKLAVSIAAWPMSDPIDDFISVGGRASKAGHPLSNLFNYVFYHFDIVQEVAVNEMNNLEPLGSKISRAMTIYPGTPEHYEVWEPYHDKCLHLASKSLENVHIHSAAITDFIFRVYELMIIYENNPDLVLHHLANRASKLGGEKLLLVECALNRYTLPKTGRGSWLTDSKDMLTILSNVSDGLSVSQEDTLSFRVQGLASTLFDKLLSPYSPKLDSNGIKVINKMMDERAGELAVLRKTVVHEAHSIVTDSPSEKMLKSAIEASLFRAEKEVSSLVNINKSNFKELTKKLTEDRVIWAAFAGFVGSVSSGMPLALSAAIGVTALSSLGSNAAKIRNESNKKLSESPYSFIHYLSNEV